MKAIAFVLAALYLLALPESSSAQDKWFAKDKAAHFSVGIGLSLGGYAGTALMSDSERARVFMGLGAGLGSAAAKELWDRSHSGTPSWRDFAWSAIGTAAGVTVAWLIDRANRPASHYQGFSSAVGP